MKRLAAVGLLWIGAGPGVAGEPPMLPTAPQIPPPVLTADRSASEGGRGLLRLIAAPIEVQGLPLPSGYGITLGPSGGAGCSQVAPGCGIGERPVWQRLRAWLGFRPESGDALPKLRPHPYVGPVVGIFPCQPGGQSGLGGAGGAECADGRCDPSVGGGRFGLGRLPARGTRGGCVPPTDDAFPGYRFATPEHAAVLGRVPVLVGPFALPVVSGPAAAQSPGGASGLRPAGAAGEPVKRPFVRP